MGLVAVSLPVFTALHLSGVLGRASRPFRPDDAGIAEAITAVVLGYGLSNLCEDRHRRAQSR